MKAVITGQAVKQWREDVEEDIPSWDKALLLVRKHKLKFEPDVTQRNCEFILIIEEFKVWDFLSGFDMKKDIIPGMQNQVVQGKLKEYWTQWRERIQNCTETIETTLGDSMMGSQMLSLLAEMGQITQSQEELCATQTEQHSDQNFRIDISNNQETGSLEKLIEKFQTETWNVNNFLIDRIQETNLEAIEEWRKDFKPPPSLESDGLSEERPRFSDPTLVNEREHRSEAAISMRRKSSNISPCKSIDNEQPSTSGLQHVKVPVTPLRNKSKALLQTLTDGCQMDDNFSFDSPVVDSLQFSYSSSTDSQTTSGHRGKQPKKLKKTLKKGVSRLKATEILGVQPTDPKDQISLEQPETNSQSVSKTIGATINESDKLDETNKGTIKKPTTLDDSVINVSIIIDDDSYDSYDFHYVTELKSEQDAESNIQMSDSVKAPENCNSEADAMPITSSQTFTPHLSHCDETVSTQPFTYSRSPPLTESNSETTTVGPENRLDTHLKANSETPVEPSRCAKLTTQSNNPLDCNSLQNEISSKPASISKNFASSSPFKAPNSSNKICDVSSSIYQSTQNTSEKICIPLFPQSPISNASQGELHLYSKSVVEIIDSQETEVVGINCDSNSEVNILKPSSKRSPDKTDALNEISQVPTTWQDLLLITPTDLQKKILNFQLSKPLLQDIHKILSKT